MSIDEILNEMDEVLEDAPNLPFSGGKRLVDVEHMRDLMGEIKLNLPDEVRQAVGSPAQLAQWGRMEESAFQSVAASNFQKNYRERMNRRKEKAVAACLGRGGATAGLRGELAPGEKILLEGGDQA